MSHMTYKDFLNLIKIYLEVCFRPNKQIQYNKYIPTFMYCNFIQCPRSQQPPSTITYEVLEVFQTPSRIILRTSTFYHICFLKIGLRGEANNYQMLTHTKSG